MERIPQQNTSENFYAEQSTSALISMLEQYYEEDPESEEARLIEATLRKRYNEQEIDRDWHLADSLSLFD